MHVISHKVLRDFGEAYPKSESVLNEWYATAERAQWKCFADVREKYSDVSAVGNQHYVFNICHNDFRLVVVIKYSIQRIFIRWIGTHKEYDKIDCSTI